MERITIVPVSGLGNRMRVVVSAAKVAKLTKTHIRIAWQSSWDCRALFEDLFEMPEIPYIRIVKGNVWDSPATKDNLFLPMLYRKFLYNKEWRCFRPSESNNLQTLISKGGSFYMDSCYALGSYQPEEVNRLFIPNALLKEQIEKVTASFPPAIAGVHIRRKDNRTAIKNSPLPVFRKTLDKWMDSGKADSIFLCTDDDNVRDYFKKAYGRHLQTRNVCLDRNSLQGIQDAVVDLWCLSKTKRILGSYYSSFSDTAAELSGIPLQIAKNENQ